MVRVLPDGSSADISGASYMDAVSESVSDLYNKSFIWLTDIGGTANAITAACTPDFDVSLAAGMSFSFKATATNTGAVTLAINTESAVPVVNTSGDALTSGAIVSGWTYPVVFDGTSFVILGSSTLTKINDYQVFTASGTWEKPGNCPDDAKVVIEAWGGGGGGGYSGSTIRNSGGGGGGCTIRIMRASELASTVAVTIGAGGAVGSNGVSGTAGGNSTFGAHLVAYGGGGGFSISSGNGYGGGGGATTAAGNTSSGSGIAAQVGLGYGHHGGAGGELATSSGENSIYGGGGGGSHDANDPTDAGSSYYGGGGGQSVANPDTDKGAAGTSVRGGNGGLAGGNGVAPGGGGGGGGNGARGEVRVWVQG